MRLTRREWVPDHSEMRISQVAGRTAGETTDRVAERLWALADRNRAIHDKECFNLNPATNVMNPRAEAMLAAGLGTRPSLGYPQAKYETGLEAIEEIETICAELCAEIFDADFVEFRVPSGAVANLFAFMATCAPGDTIIVPPASIGGHVTHHAPGAAGLYGLRIVEAPVDAEHYTIDLDALEALARKEKPKLITIGQSLNLFEHPVSELRDIADAVGARLMFDAAHQCGLIAGRAWKNPLSEGAHLMTMSTYKSLGGPAGGLIATNDADLARKLDSIAFPGLTANFDAGRVAALAVTMLDWKDFGAEYARAMIDTSHTLARGLDWAGIPVFARDRGTTTSHQFAVEASGYGGGQALSGRLRQAGFLTCGIGLPGATVEGDMNGLRIGTPELVRRGVTIGDATVLAGILARAIRSSDPSSLAGEVGEFRRQFAGLHYVNSDR